MASHEDDSNQHDTSFLMQHQNQMSSGVEFIHLHVSTLPHDSFDAKLPKVSYDAPTFANSFTSEMHLSDVEFLCQGCLSPQ